MFGFAVVFLSLFIDYVSLSVAFRFVFKQSKCSFFLSFCVVKEKQLLSYFVFWLFCFLKNSTDSPTVFLFAFLT